LPPSATIRLIDAVCCRIEGLDATTKKTVIDVLTYVVPYAKFTKYAKMGKWTGKKSFMEASGKTYINLLPYSLPVIENAGYSLNIVDERALVLDHTREPIDENYISDIRWPEGHPMAGQPILLRPHQVEMINAAFAAPGGGVIVAATGAGKTITIASISRRFYHETGGKTLIIVPNKDLVHQTKKDYDLLGLDAGVIFGDKKEFDKTHTICTWQSLSSLCTQVGEGSETALDMMRTLVSNLRCLIVDEVHTAKAKVLQTLLSGPFRNVPCRLGFTGTIPKDKGDAFAIEAMLGPIIYKVPAKQLQDVGVLSSCKVHGLAVQDGPVKINAGTWHDELEYGTTSKVFLRSVAEVIENCRQQGSGNTLVLVDRVEMGKRLNEMVLGSVFLSGKDKTDERLKEYKEFSTDNQRVIIATYGIAAVGLDISRIFHLVLVMPGKSFVRTIQSIGRGLRRAPDKSFVHIWDIYPYAKFSDRHFKERVKFYQEVEYEWTSERIKIT
jgi:superfamily II DNA or RNA helicase